jgi:hypothetical protein
MINVLKIGDDNTILKTENIRPEEWSAESDTASIVSNVFLDFMFGSASSTTIKHAGNQ